MPDICGTDFHRGALIDGSRAFQRPGHRILCFLRRGATADGSRGFQPTGNNVPELFRRGATVDPVAPRVVASGFMRRSATRFIVDPVIRGLKPTATVMRSLRDEEGMPGRGATIDDIRAFQRLGHRISCFLRRGATADRIARPIFGEVQRHAERPRPLLRPQHGSDRHLAIGHLADGPAILTRHPDRVLALFEPARVVDDQDAAAHRHALQQALPYRCHVPDRMRDEVLQRLIMARVGDAREHGLHRFPATVAQHALHVPAQRQRLRRMMETVVELLQPPEQATNARPRSPVEHCRAA